MDGKLISLRFAGHCSICEAELAAGRQAWWNRSTRTITCVRCADGVRLTDSVPGASAERVYERRHTNDEKRLGAPITADRWSTAIWKKGAAGERWLGAQLDALRDRCVVIHDRRIPGSFANIDHIVAAPSGVYVIDAKDWKGQVEIRSKATWPFRKKLLYVNKRNRTPHLAKFGAQVRAVTDAISDVRLELAPRPVMCFIDGAPRRNVTLNDVEIVGPSALREMLLSDGPLTSEQIKAVGRALVYNLREAR